MKRYATIDEPRWNPVALCQILVNVDRAQTVNGQAFATVDDILLARSVIDFPGLPPEVECHPRWWRRGLCDAAGPVQSPPIGTT